MAEKTSDYGFRLAGEAFGSGAAAPRGAGNFLAAVPRIPLAKDRGMARVAPEEKNPRLATIRDRLRKKTNPSNQERRAVEQSAFINYKDLL
jgi:hypothetical protein